MPTIETTTSWNTIKRFKTVPRKRRQSSTRPSRRSPRQCALAGIQQQPAAISGNPFTISWTHYVELLSIKDPDERSFYVIESRQSNWNVRELKRQKASSHCERLALAA